MRKPRNLFFLKTSILSSLFETFIVYGFIFASLVVFNDMIFDMF